MKYPTIRILFDRKKKSCDTRKGGIEIEVNHERKRKWVCTGVQILPSQWDEENKRVINHAESFDLNARIEAVRKPICDYISILMLKGEEFSFDGLDEIINKKKYSGSFVDFVKERIEERRDIKDITRRNHRRLNNALDAFKKIQTFDDLTPQRIRDFDDWLHGQGYTQTTVAVYHKLMKNYLHEAMAKELVGSDPYAGIRIDKGKFKRRRYLTEDELERVRLYETVDTSAMRARDLFLFQCYTGLAYADLMRFDFSNVIHRDGRFIIRDERQKTEEEFYLVLLPPAMEILKKYGMKLPAISNQKYNAALKVVAAGAGIRFNVTSHVGRHTFATYCLNKGIPIETLAAMMGHSDIKSTQIYAKMINKTVESAFDRIGRELAH